MALLPESEVDVLVGSAVPRRASSPPVPACMGGGDVRQTRAAERSGAPAPWNRAPPRGPDHVRPGPRRHAYFVATGVTGGDVLRGCVLGRPAVTQSITMRSRTGVVRSIESRHRLSTTTLVPSQV